MTSHGLTAAYTNLTDSNIDFKIINRAGKLHQLPPPRIHGLEIGPENSINYPPRNRAGKLHQLPPLEFTEPHRLPPLENRAGKLHVPFLTDFASQNLTSMQSRPLSAKLTERGPFSPSTKTSPAMEINSSTFLKCH